MPPSAPEDDDPIDEEVRRRFAEQLAAIEVQRARIERNREAFQQISALVDKLRAYPANKGRVHRLAGTLEELVRLERESEARIDELTESLVKEAELWPQMLTKDAVESVGKLQHHYQSGKGREMLPVARVRTSEARGGDEPDALLKALNEAGFTLRSLAEKLKVSHALLSQARKGTSSIGMDLAKQIEQLTGFKATRRNWPKLRQ